MRRRPLVGLLLVSGLFAAANPIAAQNPISAIERRYREQPVRNSDYSNSARLDSLIRAGHLYLSLSDAVQLAMENNLDVELQRLTPEIADTDIRRTQGGGLPRGLQLFVRDVQPGVGGPGSPLLTTIGGASLPGSNGTNVTDSPALNQQESAASYLSSIPVAGGPPIPSFDAALIGNYNFAHQTTPETSTFITGTSSLITDTYNGNFNYNQGFATGASVTAGYTGLRQNSNSARLDLNPYASGTAGTTVTQPLLRGFGRALNNRYIRIAKRNRDIADDVFIQQASAIVAAVVRQYWDLVALTEDMRVKEQALATAQKLLEDNQAQVDVGTLPPIEVKRAQAEVARSRQDLSNSRTLLEQQEMIIKNALTRSRDPRLDTADIIPTDRLEVPASDNLAPTDQLVQNALSIRPDLREAKRQLEVTGISLEGTRNALLPSIDLFATFQNNGLAGQINPTPPVAGGNETVRNPDPSFLGGTDTLLSQIARRQYPNYAVGVQLTIPLRNRVAQADLARDELQKRQTEIRIHELEKQVRLEVESAVLTVQRARESYTAAVEARQLQEEALDAEQQRYQIGASTSYFVIQAERDVEQARSSEFAAAGVYAKGRAALERALGRILPAYGVDWRGVEPRR